MRNRTVAPPMVLGALLAVLSGVASVAPAQSPAQIPATPLTVERIAIERDRDAQTGENPRWSPDDRRLGVLRTVSVPARTMHGPMTATVRATELWSIDATTGETTVLVSLAQLRSAFGDRRPAPAAGEGEEGALPGRLRDFAWTPGGHAVLLANDTTLAWFDLDRGTGRTLVTGETPLSDPQISPNGRSVAFVRDRTLWYADVASGAVRPVAGPAAADLSEGEPDWVYEQEFHLRSAYAWSADSASIAWLEFDDRKVAKYALRSSDGEEHPQSYPKPGGAIPVIRLSVRALASGKRIQVDLGSNTDQYIPRFSWTPDGKHLAIERLSRSQKSLDLLLADASTGQTRLLLNEKDTYWIDIGDGPRFLADSRRFLWSSERSGFRHLYLYDTGGRLLAQLTHGDWEVTSLVGVDEAANAVYFTSTESSPLERQLDRVRLDGSGFTRITQENGTHQAQISPAGDFFLDTFSTRAAPPQRQLLSSDGKRVATVSAGPVRNPAPGPIDAQGASRLPATEFLSVRSHMGQELHAFIVKPPDFDAAHRYPVIFYAAGGPGDQAVRDEWGGDIGLWFALMAEKGYVIFALDNRGTAGRGHLFEEPVHLRFGASEMADIRDGVLYLHGQSWVDRARIGICGWGFGGFLALHGMLDRPILFKAGFAGEAITDWHLDDAVFSERYLEGPVENQDGWLSSSPLENARNLSGPLLLAQATMDEKVHMENPLLLLDELLDSGKYADILLFADRSDLFEERATRRILFERLTDYFLKNL